MKNQIIPLIFIVILFSGCSNDDLSRAEAKNQIIESYKLPNIEHADIPGGEFGFNISQLSPEMSELVNNGYINYKKKRGIPPGVNFFMTRKAKPYFNDKEKVFAGNLLEFGEVTGIKYNESKNRASVFFNLVRKDITPFGKYNKRLEGEIINDEIEFELFDDGWRVFKNDKTVLTTKDFGIYSNEFMKKFEEETKQLEIITSNQGESETFLGIIKDPDGYTNLREKPSTSSNILTKIYEGEKIEVYIKDSPGEWWMIYHQKTHSTGYIHKSRVRLLK